MPTARPSITASRGVVDDTVAKPVAMKMSPIERATPRIAVASGIPATRNERNVTMSTSAAMRTPSASVSEAPGISVAKSCPPRIAWDPEGSAVLSAVVASRRASLVSAGTAVDSPANWMRTIAARPSSEMPPDTRVS